MKDKTIRKICRGKINAWANSVCPANGDTDSEEYAVRKAILENVYVTGGAIVSMLQDQDVNDFDVYFRTKEAAILVAEHYIKQFSEENKSWMNGKIGDLSVVQAGDRISIKVKSAGIVAADKDFSVFDEKTVLRFEDDPEAVDEPPAILAPLKAVDLLDDTDTILDLEYKEEKKAENEYQYFEGTEGDEAGEYLHDLKTRKKKVKPYGPVFLTDNAITLNDQIQIIIRFYGEPEEVHKNYDFVHCTSYYKIWDDKLVIPYEALRCIIDKELKYMGSLYPVCSIIRLRKFINRGWTVNAGQILKMCFQVSQLDLTDVNVLREQLVGVDSAYFRELINILTENNQGFGINKEVDQTYLANLIDTIFE